MSTGKIQNYYNSPNSFIHPHYTDDLDAEIIREREARKRQAGELV